MTATIDAVTGPPVVQGSPSPARGTATAQWRFAARLARREVRRRPGRTMLVVLLVAMPVLGMTVMTVLLRTNNDSAAEVWARQFGRADLVSGDAVGIVTTPTANAAAARLPASARSIVSHLAPSIGLSVDDGTARLADVTDLALDDPIAHGIVLLRSGRFPTKPGEALLSPGLAHAFHVTVGDTLRLSAPTWTERIVGVGVKATKWDSEVLAVRGNELTAPGASATTGGMATIRLVDLPGHPTDPALTKYSPAYVSAASLDQRAPTSQGVNWILVAGMVALAIVGVVIAGAFAVGARRQLVTLGQLSANGADERLLRRTLSLQGLWSGMLGSAFGFVAGAITLVLMRSTFESWIHHDPGPYVWWIRDVIAILLTGVIAATVAAFIPAKSAARVPVLHALAGRRPLASLPKRIVPIGAALFGGGVFVLVLVASASRTSGSNGLALSAVFGGLLVLAGACCVSSVVVASIARLTRFVRGSARIAVRSIVRSRARSAAVVMALAAVNAGAIAVSTALDSRTVHTGREVGFMPDNALVLTTVAAPTTSNPRREDFVTVDPATVQTLHRILPHAQWATRRVVLGSTGSTDGAGPPDAAPPIAGGSKKVVQAFSADVVTVADPATLRFVGLSSRDKAALTRSGVLALAMFQSSDAKASARTTIDVELGAGANPVTVHAAVSKDSVTGIGGVGEFLITEAKAHALGLAIQPAGVIVQNPSRFDDSQRASIDVVARRLSTLPGSATMTSLLWAGSSNQRITPDEFRTIVIGIVLLLALIVLAMSLALSAAETRDERDVLVSLGARPSTMRALSAWKASLLAAAGALVAVPTGFVPVAVVFLAVVRNGDRARLAFPWSTVLVLVVAAPIIAATAAYIGSAIAQTVRPTKMSTFATD